MRKISYFPIILLAIVILLVDLYAFQGVKTLLRHSSDTTRSLVVYAYWAISLGLISTFLVKLLQALSAGNISRTLNRVINILLTSFVTKLVFMLVLLMEDLYRLLSAILHGGLMPERYEAISQFGLLVSAIPFFAFLYGVTRGKYNYTVHQIELVFEDLPSAFDGFKLVQISDVHAGSFTRPAAVERGINLINTQKADLFVFTGDLVNNKAEEVIPYVNVFSKIEARYGKFSVLGNHDYGDYIQWPSLAAKSENLVLLKKYHKAMGFRLLLDEHITITKEGTDISLLGVENWGLGFTQKGDLKKALQGVPADNFKILLSHDPTHWERIVKNYPVKVDLTLSGHTHGMQFGIEALGIKWSPVKYRYPHWAGLAKADKRYLYINRGFGFLGFSGRVGIWPEITVITLKRMNST